MSSIPACPVCTMENTYQDGENFVCPDCAHEWPMQADTDDSAPADGILRDANGNVLAEGPQDVGDVVIRAVIDLQQAEEHGHRYHYMRDRRPEIYELLTRTTYV